MSSSSKHPGSKTDEKGPQAAALNKNPTRVVLVCLSIFFAAIIVRSFHWQDNPTPPFYGMTGEYKAHAMTLVRGDLKMFLQGPNPPSNAHVVKHPPGYPILLAGIYTLFNENDGALRSLHVLLDATAAMLVFFIAYEFFTFGVSTLSGFLVALSPQLAYHSIALLPDPLAAPPLLLGAWFLVRAYKNPRLRTVFASGLMIGVSCLLRSNTLLLPFFVGAILPLLFRRGLRVRFAAALLIGFLLMVVPVTIRNAIYFRAFIPLSLSAGITLVEGIGVYDKDKRFGLPDNDYLVSKWEAQEFSRPDYLGDRFGVDGVMRERYRVRRGLEVIRSHPIWFLKVMAQRAGSMLRLARVEVVQPSPAVRHSLAVPPGTAPAWTIHPVNEEKLVEIGPAQSSNSRERRIETRATEIFLSAPMKVATNTDYLLRVPLKVERGSVVVEVLDAQQEKILKSSPVLHPVNWLDLNEENQPQITNEVPFVSSSTGDVRMRLTNAGKPNSEVALVSGEASAFALGPASQTWTRYPRSIVRLIQKAFITAVILPFTLLGIVILARKRRWPELSILLVLPVYYMAVQSVLWTEFRYILSMHYFLFILAAVGIGWTAETIEDRAGAFLGARASSE